MDANCRLVYKNLEVASLYLQQNKYLCFQKLRRLTQFLFSKENQFSSKSADQSLTLIKYQNFSVLDSILESFLLIVECSYFLEFVFMNGTFFSVDNDRSNTSISNKFNIVTPKVSVVYCFKIPIKKLLYESVLRYSL